MQQQKTFSAWKMLQLVPSAKKKRKKRGGGRERVRERERLTQMVWGIIHFIQLQMQIFLSLAWQQMIADILHLTFSLIPNSLLLSFAWCWWASAGVLLSLCSKEQKCYLFLWLCFSIGIIPALFGQCQKDITTCFHMSPLLADSSVSADSHCGKRTVRNMLVDDKPLYTKLLLQLCS